MALTLTGPSSGLLDVASTHFTLTETVSIAAPTVFTPNDNGALGVFTPATVTLQTGQLSKTFTYTPRNAGGAKTIGVTNSAGLVNPAALTYTVGIRTLSTRTVGDVIRRALVLLGVLAGGETPTAEVQEDALQALNDMLGSWATESLLVYAGRTLQANVTSAMGGAITLGPTGTFIVPRPVNVLEAYSRLAGIDRPIAIITAGQWDDLDDKSLATGGYPDHLWYEPTFPNGTVHLSPIGTHTLFLRLQTVLGEFTDPQDQILLPSGYEQALTFNLAVQLAPEFGIEALPTVQRKAMGSKATLKRTNARAPKIRLYPPAGNVLIGWEH